MQGCGGGGTLHAGAPQREASAGRCASCAAGPPLVSGPSIHPSRCLPPRLQTISTCPSLSAASSTPSGKPSRRWSSAPRRMQCPLRPHQLRPLPCTWSSIAALHPCSFCCSSTIHKHALHLRQPGKPCTRSRPPAPMPRWPQGHGRLTARLLLFCGAEPRYGGHQHDFGGVSLDPGALPVLVRHAALRCTLPALPQDRLHARRPCLLSIAPAPQKQARALRLP